MAVIADVDFNGFSRRNAYLNIFFDKRRSNDGRHLFRCEAMIRSERRCMAEGAELRREWTEMPAQVERMRAWADGERERTGIAPPDALRTWMSDPVIAEEFETWRKDVLANRMERYYERIGEGLCFDIQSETAAEPDAQAYNLLKTRPELSNVRDA